MNNFAAVNSKIEAMSSKLLQDEDFINLAHKDSVREILEYLKINTEIGQSLDIYDDIYEAERKMQVYKKNKLEKIKHYLVDDYKKFLNSLLTEMEISEIKKILRTLQRKEGINDLDGDKLSLGSNSIFQVDSETTIPTFIEKLKKTKYYRVLKPYQDEKNDVILFYLEMNLDKLFYSELINISKSFNKENQKAVSNLLGRRIDLLNLIWIYRGLKNYKLLPEELINFSILGGYVFNYDALQRLCYKENVEEFIEEISKTQYAFLFEGEDMDIYMNRRSNRYLYYIAKKEISKNEFNFSKFLSYLFLLEFEIKDLSAIMESIRFNLTFEDTIKYMIRNYKEVSKRR
ncbi:MAG: V-type ATPase subunit [Peptoniphilaceae bacterium]